jgi:hypothetical protein
VYFAAKAAIRLRRYLSTSVDNEQALFVTKHQPVRRSSIPTLRWHVNKVAGRAGLRDRACYVIIGLEEFCELLQSGDGTDQMLVAEERFDPLFVNIGAPLRMEEIGNGKLQQHVPHGCGI